MNTLRAIGGILSLGIGGVLTYQVAAIFRPVLWPTLKQLGQEQTTFFVVRILGLTLTGGQILFFEAAVLLVACAFLFFGVYALTQIRMAGRVQQ